MPTLGYAPEEKKIFKDKMKTVGCAKDALVGFPTQNTKVLPFVVSSDFHTD